MTSLHIPSPCHEDWDAMTPQAQGRHCAACQKTVVDFSTMSDRQLLRFFDEHRNQSICGRFQNAQLQRPLVLAPPVRAPWRMAAALLAGLGLGATGYAQEITPPMTGRVAVHQSTNSTPQTDYSQVLDAESGQPLAGAAIAAYSATGELLGGTTTDAVGRFLLKDLPTTAISVEVGYLGYRAQRFALPTTATIRVRLMATEIQAAIVTTTTVKEKQIVMGGLEFIAAPKKRPWWKRLFPRKEYKSWKPKVEQPLPQAVEAVTLPASENVPVLQEKAATLTISPNPARTRVTVTFPADFIFPLRVNWVSVDGRTLRTRVLTSSKTTVLQLPQPGNTLRTLLLSVEDARGRVLTEQVVQAAE